MSDLPTRVILLARAGEARTRLEAAVREAGAEIAAVCDPVDGDPEALASVSAQAVLVALDPGVEDALDRFEALLADPSRTVIFDEAELAARREGWDAARWARHLAAKLNRHDDVLPPGGETENDWQPVPGPLATARIEIGELDISAFTGEALERASDVPRDARLESVPGLPTIEFDLDSIPATPDQALPESASDEAGLAVGLVSVEDMDWSSSSSGFDAGTLDAGSLEDNEFAAFLRNAQALAADDASAGGLEADAPAQVVDDLDYGADFASLLDMDLAEPGADEATPISDTGRDDDRQAPASIDADAAAAGSGLSLVDDDAPIADNAGVGGQRIERDLEALEQRVAGLALADSDSYGHGPLRGVVLLEGGLGGPDAVRQVLSALPEGFPRAVLVRLQLDGGRYDRLVKQMQRGSVLPVALAVAGQPATPGSVYFLSPSVTVEEARGMLVFAEQDAAAGSPEELYAVLPALDSAVLFLSGAALALVDPAGELQARGGLVAAQSPDSCYDGVAAAAVLAGGGLAAAPGELAAQLAERWTS